MILTVVYILEGGALFKNLEQHYTGSKMFFQRKTTFRQTIGGGII